MRRLLAELDRIDARAAGLIEPVSPSRTVRWGVAYADPTAGRATSRHRRGIRPRREAVIVGLIVALVTGGLLKLRQEAPVAALDGMLGSWSGQQPPPPADASSHRLLAEVAGPGGSGGYSVLQTGLTGPVRWDPCRPIHLVINDEAAPADSDAIVADALARVSSATGLKFVVDGPTSELASPGREAVDRGRYGWRWSPVLLAWTTPNRVPGLEGDVAGLAGPTSTTSATGRTSFVSGTVYLDGPTAIQIESTRRNGSRQVEAIVMHELGHLVGLGHIDDTSELMAPKNSGRTDFGAGDLRGLAAVGRGDCHLW